MYQPKYNGIDRYKPIRVGTNDIDRYRSAQITKRNKGIIVSFNYRNGINQYRYDTDNTDFTTIVDKNQGPHSSPHLYSNQHSTLMLPNL